MKRKLVNKALNKMMMWGILLCVTIFTGACGEEITQLIQSVQPTQGEQPIPSEQPAQSVQPIQSEKPTPSEKPKADKNSESKDSTDQNQELYTAALTYLSNAIENNKMSTKIESYSVVGCTSITDKGLWKEVVIELKINLFGTKAYAHIKLQPASNGWKYKEGYVNSVSWN